MVLKQMLKRKSPERNKVIKRVGRGVAKRKRISIIYFQEFREFLRRNPELRIRFFEALSSGKKTIKFGNMKIAAKSDRTWRVDLGEKSFFIKVASDRDKIHSGPQQFSTLQKTERLLENMFPHIETVKYHMGWSYQGKHYLVTDYYGLKKLEDVQVPRELGKEFCEFQTVAWEKGIKDIKEINAFFDRKRNKIIIFDPHE